MWVKFTHVVGETHERPMLPRHAEHALARLLETFPVVVVTGARQAGKSTLVRESLAGRAGYPVPAHELTTEDQRQAWFAGYEAAYLERDLRALSAVENLADMRRLMTALCPRGGWCDAAAGSFTRPLRPPGERPHSRPAIRPDRVPSP